MRNGTYKPFLLLLITAAALTAMGALPPVAVSGYEVKPVLMLADVAPEGERIGGTSTGTQGTTVPTPPVPRDDKGRTDTRPVPKGMVPIEDFGITEGGGMTPLYRALRTRASLGRPVRIAYFGDSFIEGDILTADLRTLLQQKFGGCGVGYVDIASPFTSLRSTVRHNADGMTDHHVMNRADAEMSRLGLTCRYATGGTGASVTLSGVRNPARLDSFECATLYLTATAPQTVSLRTDAGSEQRTVDGDGRVRAIAAEHRTHSVTFTLGAGGGKTTLYGIALEGRNGIVLDNFSLRGSSGAPLASIPEKHLAEMSAVRPYDLIVLQFGLNVAAKKQLKYDAYVKQMKRVVSHFRTTYPRAGILIVSVGDREDKGPTGELQTMDGIKALVDYQRQLAAETHSAFWNLYEGMGGEGAIRRMAETRPAEAGKDYTHINHRGGRRIAGILYRTLLYGYAGYKE